MGRKALDKKHSWATSQSRINSPLNRLIWWPEREPGSLTGGSVFVGVSVEFSDIHATVSIFVIIVSVFIGAINALTGKANKAEISVYHTILE